MAAGSITATSGATIALPLEDGSRRSGEISLARQGRGLWFGAEMRVGRFGVPDLNVGCVGERSKGIRTWAKPSSLGAPTWFWRGTALQEPRDLLQVCIA